MSLDFYLYIDVDTGAKEPHRATLFDSNITHNLNTMAEEAGIYKCLWRPDENGFKYAKDIIKPLTEGLEDLKARPDFFESLNSPNGWGKYENFVPFVERILAAAKEHPKALIGVWR